MVVKDLLLVPPLCNSESIRQQESNPDKVMAGLARALGMLMVVVGVGLGLARAGCVVDEESVKDESQRLEQENLLQTLDPIMGQR